VCDIFVVILSEIGECQFPRNNNNDWRDSRNKKEVQIPMVMRGQWFSREKNVNTYTTFDANTMTGRGYLVNISNAHNVNYSMMFSQDNCYHCVRIIVRTVNIIEKIESELHTRFFVNELLI